MWKYGNRTIRPGKGWVDDNKVRHPSNWHIWSAEEKAKYNITEVTEDTPPDSRLYNWSMDNDGKITSTAKALDDSKGVVGLKTTMKNEVKVQQGSLLNQTDWAYIRHYDAGTEVPAKIETWRNAIRTKATEMEDAIDKASDIDGIAALLASWDNNDEANSMSKFREAAKVIYDNDEANSLSKFKEVAAKTLKIDIPTEEDTKRIEGLLEDLGIYHLKDREITKLSGGEKRLALLARALAQEPELLILDEPTAHLDLGNKVMTLKALRDMAESGRTVLFSTHDPNEALLIADHVAILSEGEIMGQGAPSVTITEEILRAIYGADIRVIEVEGRLIVDLPDVAKKI